MPKSTTRSRLNTLVERTNENDIGKLSAFVSEATANLFHTLTFVDATNKADIQKSRDQLQKKVGELRARRTALSSQVITLETEISALKDSIGALENVYNTNKFTYTPGAPGSS